MEEEEALQVTVGQQKIQTLMANVLQFEVIKFIDCKKIEIKGMVKL